MYNQRLRNWLSPVLLSAMALSQMTSAISAAAEVPRPKHIQFNDYTDEFARFNVSLCEQPDKSMNLHVQSVVNPFPGEPAILLEARVNQATKEREALERILIAMLKAGASREDIKAIVYLRLDVLVERDAALRALYRGSNIMAVISRCG